MSREVRKPEDYTYIAAWGTLLGSNAHYIKAAQEKALEDHAPLDAVYREDNGTWVCRWQMPTRTRDIVGLTEKRIKLGVRGT